jgi:hypothetical protein
MTPAKQLSKEQQNLVNDDPFTTLQTRIPTDSDRGLLPRGNPEEEWPDALERGPTTELIQYWNI